MAEPSRGPRVSLITACWNASSTIGDTLRSVAAQGYPEIEHIVVDGASEDGTRDIVGNFPHVARFVSEPDRGIYDAFNKGIGLATGEIVAHINADDFYCADDVIERVVAEFDLDPELEALHADLVYVDPVDTSRILRHWRGREISQRQLRRGFVPAHPTLFLRRSVYDRVGLFDLTYRLAADYEFMLRMFTQGVKARYVPDIWVRMRAGGATGQSLASIKRQNEEIRDAQRRHGIDYPRSRFLVHKLIDRSLQRARAPFVRLPTRPGAMP